MEILYTRLSRFADLALNDGGVYLHVSAVPDDSRKIVKVGAEIFAHISVRVFVGLEHPLAALSFCR
tara:strand:+ start:493 stop:690 length:198 start_codon:yes stop_codon:yes gene_type:complete